MAGNVVVGADVFRGFPRVGDLIDDPLGGFSYDGYSTGLAVAWLRAKAHKWKALGQPWFMALNLVNRVTPCGHFGFAG